MSECPACEAREPCGASACELRTQGDTSKLMTPAWAGLRLGRRGLGFLCRLLGLHARRSDPEIDQDRRGDEDRGIRADQHDAEDHGRYETVDGMTAEVRTRMRRKARGLRKRGTR